MSYATLMVHLELGTSNAGRLAVVAELAQRWRSAVIGIVACQPLQAVVADGYVSSDVLDQDQSELAREIDQAQAEFRQALQGRAAALEWRSSVTYAQLADYLAREARGADLIVTGLSGGDLFDASRSVNTGDLVLHAGRPVLLVPLSATTLALQRVVVGWKDTREARRAVADALPLLQQATEVRLLRMAAHDELAEAGRQLEDVAHWLARHGVVAECQPVLSTGDDATALYAQAKDWNTDVIVAGAYGHSRLREWVFGGVTRDLLLSANRCALLSH